MSDNKQLYHISYTDDNKLLINTYTIETELDSQYTLDNGHMVDKSILNTHANDGVYALDKKLALLVMKKYAEACTERSYASFLQNGELYDAICEKLDVLEES